MRRHASLVGLVLLVLFEGAAVWFIMPLPGSQRVRSVEVAYALHVARWPVRALGLVLMGWGLSPLRVAGLGRRITIATGHGMLGITLGPVSGELAADCVTGAAVAPDPLLDPARFR